MPLLCCQYVHNISVFCTVAGSEDADAWWLSFADVDPKFQNQHISGRLNQMSWADQLIYFLRPLPFMLPDHISVKNCRKKIRYFWINQKWMSDILTSMTERSAIPDQLVINVTDADDSRSVKLTDPSTRPAMDQRWRAVNVCKITVCLKTTGHRGLHRKTAGHINDNCKKIL